MGDLMEPEYAAWIGRDLLVERHRNGAVILNGHALSDMELERLRRAIAPRPCTPVTADALPTAQREV
jgi:hypothetical protein